MTTRTMRALATCAVVAAFVLVAPWVTTEAAPGKEVCPAGIACGGQTTPVPIVGPAPPGPFSWCSPEDVGKDCEYCTGTDMARLCVDTGCKTCINVDKQRNCGDPKKGTCTKGEIGIRKNVLTYYYCKDNKGGAGKRSCKMERECKGDK